MKNIFMIFFFVSTLNLFSQVKEDLNEEIKKDILNQIYSSPKEDAFVILNLLDNKCDTFNNGIYRFSGIGPHYPYYILIKKDNKSYLFKSIGAFNPTEMLFEYIEAIHFLQLNDDEVLNYLNVLSRFLETERGKTYGREFLNTQ